jgi:polar amino acid transport system substrate-binding protein
MLKKFVLFILGFFIFTTPLYAMDFNDLKYYTENYPPYNYEENGKLTGIGVETLKLVWEELGVNQKEISLVPWARGYKTLQEAKDTVLFSTTRVPEREDLFKWACPIHKGSRDVLLGKKGMNYNIDEVTDLNDYKVGTIREDISEQRLLDKGVDRGAIDSVAKLDLNFKKLDMGRIDFFAYGENSLMDHMEKSGINKDDYEIYFILDKARPLCYAFNKNADEEIVQKFQDALSKVVNGDEYKKIQEKFK